VAGTVSAFFLGGVRPKLRLFTGIPVVVDKSSTDGHSSVCSWNGKYHGESQHFVHTLGVFFLK